MAGFDKFVREEWLLEHGWTKVAPPEGSGDHYLAPPADLWERRPPHFYVYDAIDLHYALTGENFDDEP